MWGYGARHDKLSEGTLDPLYAEAVVLQVNQQKLAIVGLDLGRSPNEASLQAIRQRIKDKAGVEFSFIAGSHTHHGPVMELSNQPGKGKEKFDAAIRYYKQLEDAIVDAIVEADARKVMARVGAGTAKLEGFNRNRHTKILPKPVDTDLSVLRLDTTDGKAIATIVNYTAHPTSIPAEQLKFSADYPGAMKAAIAAQTGGGAVFMQGASGDQSTDRGNRDYKAFGEALAEHVMKLRATLAPRVVDKPSLVVKEERFTFASRIDFGNPLIAVAFGVAFFPELVGNFMDEYAQGIRPRISAVWLNGDIAMVGASGEFFANHAIRLKERARVPVLFFFGYCNGYHQYFPTIEAVSEGGYGADNTVSPVAVGAGEQLMNQELIWLYQMRGKIK